MDWLAGRMYPDLPYGHYEIYFAYCALAYLVVGHFVTALRERRRRVSSGALAYRSTGLFARGCVASLYWLALMKVVLFLGLIAKELIT